MTAPSKRCQHRRSVETLGLSGTDDKTIIAEIQHLVNCYEPKYEKNVLPRVKSLLERYKP